MIKFCHNHGGYLAEINTKEETELVNMFLPTEQYHWIGLNDLASPGNWKWQNSYLGAVNYTNWIPGRPASSSLCAMIDISLEGQKWVDENCLLGFSNPNTHAHAFCETDNKNE